MIIHRPQVATDAAGVRVEAAFEVEREIAGLPSTLWFAFPPGCEEHVSERADGFAVALLPLAMNLGEAMHVEGAISHRLAHGMREYQRIQSTWKPGLFREVDVRCSELRSGGRDEVAGAVGLAFSGGVDSFYALRTHLADTEPFPPSRITHCLMINGFDEDTDLDDAGSFRAIQRLYEPLMARLGLELIVVRTNLLEILGAIVRSQSFGAFLLAPALLLGRLFSRFYIATGCKFTLQGMIPDGSHPMLDHLLATETLETMNTDAHLTRLEKTLALSGWPEAYDRLRVCWRPTGVQGDPAAIANCCVCEKCLRTMMTLDAAGVLDRFRCFPQQLLPARIRNIDYRSEQARLFSREIIEFAARQGRRDLVRHIHRAMFNSISFRPKVRAAVWASYWIEQHSRLYRTLLVLPKRALRRLGWDADWLFEPRS